MSAILEVEGLSKRFGKVVTAEDLTFTVERGRALGIVGPNGAGKSTLLSLVTGVLPADAGRIRFAGEDITSASAGHRSRAGIARTFQIPRPFTTMTVFENVYVGAAFGGRTSGQSGYEAAAEALESSPASATSPTRRPARSGCWTASGSSWPGPSRPGPTSSCSTRSPAASPRRRCRRSSRCSRGCARPASPSCGSSTSSTRCSPSSTTSCASPSAPSSPRGARSEVMASPEVIEVYLGSTFDVEGAAS